MRDMRPVLTLKYNFTNYVMTSLRPRIDSCWKQFWFKTGFDSLSDSSFQISKEKRQNSPSCKKIFKKKELLTQCKVPTYLKQHSLNSKYPKVNPIVQQMEF